MAAAGSSMPMQASVDIHHSVVGCHTWSVNSGPYAADRALVLIAGEAVSFTNHDHCGILLKQTGGPADVLATGKVLVPLGQPYAVNLSTPGVYTFKGTDYNAADLEPYYRNRYVEVGTSDMWRPPLYYAPTTGPDNVLTLTIRVNPSSPNHVLG